MNISEISGIIEAHVSQSKPVAPVSIVLNREREPVASVCLQTQVDEQVRYMSVRASGDPLTTDWLTVQWGQYPAGGGKSIDARTFGPLPYVLHFLDVWIVKFGEERDLPPPPREEHEQRRKEGPCFEDPASVDPARE